MTSDTRISSNYVYTFLCSLLSVFWLTHGAQSDIYCLKSIKNSLEDPLNYLSSSWDFKNITEGTICRFVGVECWHPDENRVLNLQLPNMGLKGQFPRGVENCTSLVGLNLSSNNLSGNIPSDISKLMPFVTSFDLSHNEFYGVIPRSIANCSYINVLRLDSNRLSGHIPQEIGSLGRIKVFDVAYNLLSGPVPVFVKNNVSVNYANNNGLCGGPLGPC